MISLVLPWAGLALLAAGVWASACGHGHWLLLLLAGGALIAADLVIDFAWAHPAISQSDLPDLNARPQQLAGRVLVLVEPIEGGLGKLRCDDTLWQVEGPDLPAGTPVRVTGARGMRLAVEPLH